MFDLDLRGHLPGVRVSLHGWYSPCSSCLDSDVLLPLVKVLLHGEAISMFDVDLRG